MGWSAKHKWVSRANARDSWLSSVSDEQIVVNLKACLLALTTRGHEFLKSTDSADFLRAARRGQARTTSGPWARLLTWSSNQARPSSSCSRRPRVMPASPGPAAAETAQLWSLLRAHLDSLANMRELANADKSAINV